MDQNKSNTDLLHTPFAKKDAYNALNFPVYQNAAFEFDSAEQMELAFTGKSTEHTYSRISNPTVQYLEDRVKSITGAYSVTALNSGMAAITNTIFTIAKSGANIVTSAHLFGNTYSFFASTLSAFGVEVRFCNLTNPSEVSQNIDANTCAVFLEIITNPQMEVVDLEMISGICKKHNIPLIADTTIIPFCAFNAKKFGIDIEIVSSTKYISAGATSLGGLILDYGLFNWSTSPKLRTLAVENVNAAFTVKLRKEIHRNLGAYMSPQAAYFQTIGLETLMLRYEKSSNTCFDLVTKLKQLPEIEHINYCSLPDNPYFEISRKQFGNRSGAMFTIDLSSRETCFRFLNKLKLIKRATNLFDNKSLAIHPSSTIYGNFSNEQKIQMNVSDKTIRFSVGLENTEELFEDIKHALKI